MKVERAYSSALLTPKTGVALCSDSFNGEPEASAYRAKSKSPTACR